MSRCKLFAILVLVRIPINELLFENVLLTLCAGLQICRCIKSSKLKLTGKTHGILNDES